MSFFVMAPGLAVTPGTERRRNPLESLNSGAGLAPVP